MTVITLDLETYFDHDYTLRKLTTEGYIRDPRFEALCLGVKYDERPAVTVGKGSIGQLKTHVGKSGVVCHHAHFDGLIMSHHFGMRPRFWFDTLSMARLAFPHDKSHSLENLAAKFEIGHKTVPYEEFKGKRDKDMSQELKALLWSGCSQDVELTYQIFKKLLPLVPKEELKVIDMTVRMFTEPVLSLDRPRAQEYANKLIKQQDELLASLGVTKQDLGSADKFAELLKSYGLEPPTKKSPRTGKTAYAFAKTDQGFLELVNHEEERVRLLAEARLSTKSTIGETRAGRLLSMSERGNLCVYLKYFGAHTGRWSGGDKLNFQNFPRGGELRKSLLAPEGFVLCVADLSQIECVAHGQKVLTRTGYKPIQDVKLTDEVWDGQEFCAHEGVVLKGVQKVISYEGVTATPEHIVFVGSHSRAQGIPLQVARALRIGISDANLPDAVRKETVPISELPWIQDIRCKRGKIQFLVRGTVCTLGMGELTPRNIQWCRDRQNRQQRALRGRKLKIVYAQGERKQSVHYFLCANGRRSRISYARFFEEISKLPVWTGSSEGAGYERAERGTDNRKVRKQIPSDVEKAEEAKVYDIVNCGPRFKFMCSGKIVSNCRMLNYLANEKWVLDAFREGRDLYCEMASAFYGRTITKADKKERFLGKTLVLGAGYGVGWRKLQGLLKLNGITLTDAEAEHAINTYRGKHTNVVKLWKHADWILSKMYSGDTGYLGEWGPMRIQEKTIVLPNGVSLDYNDLATQIGERGQSEFVLKHPKGITKIYGGKLVENVVQALSRVVMSQAMLKIGSLYKVVLVCHDEVVYLVPEEEASIGLEIGLNLLKQSPPWCENIPLDAEGGYAKEYSK